MAASAIVSIRPAHPGDLPALYRVCHATGINGHDASVHVHDPDLIAHIYAGPYAVLEPNLVLVATVDQRVAGYVLGTADTIDFHRRTEADWFPALRERYRLPAPEDTSHNAEFLRALHRGHPPPAGIDLHRYPAHLHIDLLPVAQGHGLGRRLIEQWFALLRERRIPGAHLYVSSANPRAIAFYEHLGFERVDTVPGAFGYARAAG